MHVEDVGEMRKAFSVFDQDGSGNISVLELNKVFESCGVKLNMTELEAIVKEVDKDGGGEIGFSEFVALMVQQGAIKSDPLIKARAAFDHFDI
uniref:EF-hand domain-containing protein n=1 Tax=Guillardia theta (strain CCMP2712) TaxID=905079 RepID=A0A0C3UGB5_GUITC